MSVFISEAALVEYFQSDLDVDGIAKLRQAIASNLKDTDALAEAIVEVMNPYVPDQPYTAIEVQGVFMECGASLTPEQAEKMSGWVVQDYTEDSDLGLDMDFPRF